MNSTIRVFGHDGNAVADRDAWLSPRQQPLCERIDALFKDLARDSHEALFKQMRQDLNPSQYRNLYTMNLAEYQTMLLGYLEKLEKRESADASAGKDGDRLGDPS
jgi:hypothetical protein